ncbi:Glycerol-3-phosphate acyltransferase [Paramyrothecium foliicola]|nr:Glycerol-3-phosphate acyltransferase [Paramyrothecium foliicola]
MPSKEAHCATMADKDDTLDPASNSAPDLQILGDSITLQPSGYVGPNGVIKDGQEEALMNQFASFRSEPLQFLREVSLYVSGQGWRAYDRIIGQPVFYPGFSEQMISTVLSTPLLQKRIVELAANRLAVEEREGLFPKDDKDYAVKVAQRRNALESGLQEVAEKLTDQMICKMESKTFIRGAYYLATQLLTRAYHQGIHVSSEEVLRLRRVADYAAKKKQSIIFLPSHRSHVDYVSLQLICYRLGLTLPVVVAGDNLNFPVVGSFLQHAGAMWIRRAFGDDALYTTLVQSYVDTLLQNGYNFECFIEGGRSRTGKLLPPKFGILSFVLDSILSGRVEDTIICPVSTQYDKVIETEGYVTELLGMPKKKENLADFLSSGSSVLSLRLGRVDVRFNEPWSMRKFIDQQLSKLPKVPSGLHTDHANPEVRAVREKLLRTLGYKVLGDINAVSVVMPTALIGTVLLTLRGRGVGKAELTRRVDWLTTRVRAKGGRVAHFGNAPLSEIIDRGLDVLGKELVGVVNGLAEPTYYAVDRFQLSFYRNMTIHLFIYEALVSAAMYTRVKFGGGPTMQDIAYDELRDQVLFLSSLFRGEFIFAGAGLATNLDKTLRGLEADNVVRLDRDSDGKIVTVGLSDEERKAGRENYDFYCFLIWPFIESSWLAAVSLMGLTPTADQDGDVWIEQSKAHNSAQLLGKTLYHQGDLSYFEAVNKETLKNSYTRFAEDQMVHVVKSKDPKIPLRIQLDAAWRPPRDPQTGDLLAQGKLWDFTEQIAKCRREGKNRRDGATVSSRVLRLADQLGRKLFEEAEEAAKSGKEKVPSRLSSEEKAVLQKSRQHLDSAAQHRALGRVDGGHLLHGLGVGQRDVVDLEHGALVGHEHALLLLHGGADLVGGLEEGGAVEHADVVEGLDGAEGAVEDGGDAAPARAEVDVAGAEGDAVVVAAGGADDDVGGQYEVLDHAADDDGLLHVLLAEVDTLGLDNVEELHADGGDAAEEGGPARALEDLPHRRHGHERALAVDLLAGEAGRVHLGGGRREDGGDAAQVLPVIGQLAVQPGQHGRVGVPGDGIGAEILAGAELGRVDVYAHDDVVVLAGGGPDQREVALVQRAHGRHEADGAVVDRLGLPPLADGVDGPQDLDRRRGHRLGHGSESSQEGSPGGTWTGYGANGAGEGGGRGHDGAGFWESEVVKKGFREGPGPSGPLSGRNGRRRGLSRDGFCCGDLRPRREAGGENLQCAVVR